LRTDNNFRAAWLAIIDLSSDFVKYDRDGLARLELEDPDDLVAR
jgi:hypothetical protein